MYCWKHYDTQSFSWSRTLYEFWIQKNIRNWWYFPVKRRGEGVIFIKNSFIYWLHACRRMILKTERTLFQSICFEHVSYYSSGRTKKSASFFRIAGFLQICLLEIFENSMIIMFQRRFPFKGSYFVNLLFWRKIGRDSIRMTGPNLLVVSVESPSFELQVSELTAFLNRQMSRWQTI